MMTLDGWDTASITDIKLVNASMSARQNELITEFDFRERTLHLHGRFGAWEILPGGSLQLLNVRIPINSGALKGMPGRHSAVHLSGVALVLKVALRLLPPPVGSNKRDLMFDLLPSESSGADDPVLPLDIDDPLNKLSELQKTLLRTTAAACLSAHAAEVSYVFASVETRGTTTSGLLSTPFSDWCHVVTSEGRQYLAVLGALSEPAGGVRKFDPGLIAKTGSAYLVLSNRMFIERVLAPTLNTDFRPRAPFVIKGDKIRNKHPIPLPPQKYGLAKLEPVIRSIVFSLKASALSCVVSTKTDIGLGAVLTCNLDMTMPFVFDVKKRQVRFKPDPKPKETHTANLPGILDALIGWLVRWIVSFFDKPVREIAMSAARGMQKINAQDVSTTNWIGVRDFQVGNAMMDGCFWFCDTRPA